MTLLEEMKTSGVEQNIRLYNTLLRGCIRTGEDGIAVQL